MPSLATRLGAAFKAARAAFRMRFTGAGGQGLNSLYGWISGILPGTQQEWERLAGPLWLNPVASICLGWIADNFVEPELVVQRQRPDGTREIVRGHALPELIGAPNPYYDGDTLWQATLLSYCTDGNAYWIKARAAGGSGRPVELYWVPHWLIEPRWPEDGSEFISHYVYRVQAEEIRLERSEVIHFRFGIDPDNQRRGLSRLRAMQREIYQDNEGSTYGASLLGNMAVPSVLITPEKAGSGVAPARFGKDQIDQIREQWAEQAGRDRRGRPIVTTGAVTIQTLSLSPEELALDKIRQVPEARICAALRVPAMVAGISVGDAQRTYANYGEARRAAYEDCLLPMGLRMARTLRRELLPDLDPSPDLLVAWDYSQIRALAEDQDQVHRRAVADYRGGIVRRSESRRMIGLESLAEDEQYYSPPAGPPVGDPVADAEKR